MEQIRIEHHELDYAVERINSLAKAFNGSTFFSPFEKDVSFTSFEVCFKDTVSWLYILLIEAGDQNLKFTITKIKDLGIQQSVNGSAVITLIMALRTSRQHLMDTEKPDDKDKLSYRDEWFKKIIGVDKPSDESQWKICLTALINDILLLLNIIQIGIEEFEKDEFSDVIKEDWDRLINRTFRKHDWEIVLIDVLNDYGMMHYDTLEIATKELNKWREKLKILKDGFDFKTEARRIIESFLLAQDIWPGTATDLISLGVPKGPGLGDMVKKAKELYYESPCPKHELLEKFKQKYLDKPNIN